MSEQRTRTESDLLGPAEVPVDAYYGVHSLRAVNNFPITGVPIGHYEDLVNGLALVKAASARANHKLGLLSAERAQAIEEACQLITKGQLHDQFVIDLIQGGADVRVVQELLGHSSVTTTQVYTKVTAETLKEVYFTAHPRALHSA